MIRYLRETAIRSCAKVCDSYSNYHLDMFFYKFNMQTIHIAYYFMNLIYRKIKTDCIEKAFLYLSPIQLVNENGPLESERQMFCYYDSSVAGRILSINAYFDFYQYLLFESDLDRSKAITDVFEVCLVNALSEHGVGADGTTTVKNAIDEIRKNNYVYKGMCKQSLLSPNKTYKVTFEFVWKLRGVELYVHIRKPYAKRDLCISYFATLLSTWTLLIKQYIESIVWTSEDEFVATMNDLSGRKKAFNITEYAVRDYEKGDLKTY